MKLNWERYFYGLGSSAIQNVGVVGSMWLTLNGLNAVGVDVPQMNLKALGWSILVAGALPAIFNFWKTTPLPEVETQETTVTVTKTVSKPPEPEPEVKP